MRRSFSATVAAAALLSAAPPSGADSGSRLTDRLDASVRRAPAASGVFVYDLSEGRRLYARRATRRRILASNVKLFTTGAALARFGARHRFVTEVLADRPPDRRGIVRGNVYLRGGGDPSFGSESFARRAYGGRGGATIAELARALRAAGVRRVTGRVLGDETLFDSLRGGPGSGYDVSVWVGPLSALSYNRGLAREDGSAFQRVPPRFAASRLLATLESQGVHVDGSAGVRRTAASAWPLAAARSISLARLARITNTVSDNFFAETLAKHLDAAPGNPGTTAGGSAAASVFARRLGARVRLVDGSGLARDNVATPRGVVRFLRGMRARRAFRPFYDSLARPGGPGTLNERMRRGPARARCRGKTGTISGVSNLSGYCRTKSGDLTAYSILMNGVWSYDAARRQQDRMVQAIARYG